METENEIEDYETETDPEFSPVDLGSDREIPYEISPITPIHNLRNRDNMKKPARILSYELTDTQTLDLRQFK